MLPGNAKREISIPGLRSQADCQAYGGPYLNLFAANQFPIRLLDRSEAWRGINFLCRAASQSQQSLD